MKLILNKDTLKLDKIVVGNSGSVNYYEAEVEYDESWNNLNIEAVIVKKYGDKGTSIAVINNKFFIDKKLSGDYYIGFVGYTIENDKKTYQISSNLKYIHFDKGAGEIETENEELPTPTEWEIYIAQIKSIVSDIEGLSDELNKKVTEVENKLDSGELNGKDATINGRNAIEIEAGKNIEIEETENGIKINSTGSGTGGAVNSVNGQTGAVVLKTSDLENDSNFATKSEIPDVSEFIKKTVNDLVNYYKKSETYTQEEINQMVSAIPKFKIEVINSLPQTGDTATIYLLKSGEESQNLYTEYIYVNNTWEKLGTQKVDLSNYVEKENGKSLLADTEIARLLTLHNYDDSEIRELINGKQDKIEDLNIIREGAAKGATAIQEHQDISGKADKIYVIENENATELEPNKLYKWGEVESLNLTLGTPIGGILNEYMFEFISGATPTTLTLPDSVKWESIPNIEANKKYQISIVDDIALMVGV